MAKILKFPENFLWGASTSAHQVEGGNHNDWSEWENSPARLEQLKNQRKNPEDYISGRACDSYNRYEEDFDLCSAMNNNAHRLGIEWSRIEPEEGRFDMVEVEHYRKVLMALKKRNLKTVVTLWHWSNPVWLAAEGGWADKRVSEYFFRYADLIVKELGKFIDYWVILNEPFVHIGHGYLTGKFPPNRKADFFNVLRVNANFIKAYKGAYRIIHNKYPAARATLTFLTGYVEPARKWCPVEWLLAKIMSYIRNDYFFYRIKNHFDFIGVDYYHHDRVVWHPPFIKNKNEKVSDFGWEIYPEGIYHVLKNYQKFNKPILILENGVADAKDQYRKDFIIDHLKWVHKAIAEGADVRGYFHWSLLDNFEWSDGYAMKFGLHAVDRKTFKRTARPSARVYGEICKNNRLIVD